MNLLNYHLFYEFIDFTYVTFISSCNLNS